MIVILIISLLSTYDAVKITGSLLLKLEMEVIVVQSVYTIYTLQLTKVKCLPVLLHDLEACPLAKSDLQSLDFVVNRFFMKLFTTKNIEVVKYCQEYFGFALPSALLWAKRVSEFEFSFKCFLSAL